MTTKTKRHLRQPVLDGLVTEMRAAGPANRDLSQMTHSPGMTAKCLCGRVELTASGRPIVSSVCYCRDCQAGGRQIEALPNAPAVSDSGGGTAYVLYRKDRIACSSGADLLKSYKLKQESVTNRVVATCCNSAMFMNFDKGPFWVSAYRARFQGEVPPLEMRICTKYAPDGAVLVKDIPSHPGYPPQLVARLLVSGAAMLIGR